MADPARARKMADRIKEIVARRLDKGLRDPRLGFVTITDVRVTGDLQHASIFYTVYGSEEERHDSALALTAATGMLRSEVGRNITARLTPTLEFIPDAIPENAELIESLLREARTLPTSVGRLSTRPIAPSSVCSTISTAWRWRCASLSAWSATRSRSSPRARCSPRTRRMPATPTPT